MKKPLWLVVWLLVIELVVILLLVPGDWTDKAIEKESRFVESNLGSGARYWIRRKADDWYHLTMIDSGFYEGMYFTLIPTEHERARSRGMQNMGSWWFQWVEGRMEALANVVYQFFTRSALFLLWAPYMLILLAPALYDGAMTWKIKRTNFDYASPVIHRYSIRLTTYLILGLGIAFFAPIALNPVIIPVVMMVCCVLIGLTMGNLQKRV
ncbi:DUF4400 domain-containing protein [Marinobacterium aestuariivivens]|uniref:DUF4400 domain-containing protein n=1 Tax=Marinobacterium aestuariivivens TaxID=1698799 RepID=A0ABW2A9H4_9GAMM